MAGGHGTRLGKCAGTRLAQQWDRMTTETTTPTGLLLLDKPIGPTSMQACAAVRARLRRGGAPKRVKVGHGGTLDPLATGLLVILVGKATPLCAAIMAGEKEYEAEIDLSGISPTDDAEGQVAAVAVARIPTREDVERACARFVGTIQQTPPAYSAVHVGGVRAYQLARQGQTERLAAGLVSRPVEIREIEALAYEWPRLRVRVVCGKGTYIRVLARDLGASMGVGGYLTGLRRTRIGAFDVRVASAMDRLPEVLTQADLMPIPPMEGGSIRPA